MWPIKGNSNHSALFKSAVCNRRQAFSGGTLILWKAFPSNTGSELFIFYKNFKNRTVLKWLGIDNGMSKVIT